MAVEWRINRLVLVRYGPLLHGALTLAFHNTCPGGLTLQLRQNLGFHPSDPLRFVQPASALAEDRQVRLQVAPAAV